MRTRVLPPSLLTLLVGTAAAFTLAACSSTGSTGSAGSTGSTAAAGGGTSGASASGGGASTSRAAGSGNTPGTSGAPGRFTLTSTAFADGAPIPRQYTCQGSNTSPPLAWSGVPTGTKSLALLMVDPDAPIANGFTHWVVADIDPAATGMPEGAPIGTPGKNGGGKDGWTGPCPPSGNHHYVFTLYALPQPIEGTIDRAAIERAGTTAMGTATLTGTYQRS